MLVGVQLYKPQWGELDPEESLEELGELAWAAGGEVVDKILQSRDRPDRALYIGRGLAEELALVIQSLQIDLVIFDTELSGTQLRNLEEALECKILDRTSLILDIFAQRAQSREGKIQVELAQLEYLLPRLVGKGTELSRLAGGIGTRGPGETKLERDRRHIQRRISDLKKQLAQLSKQREVTKGKRELPVAALVGYTNAGKSTLRHQLLRQAASAPVDWSREDPGTAHLFATLDSTVRGITLPNDREILIADTVGFIQKLPHQLVSAFKATLEEVQEADLLLHVVDASHHKAIEQIVAVEKVLAELGMEDKPMIIVFNKIDLLQDESLFHHEEYPTIGVSARTGAGIQELLKLLAVHLIQTGREMELLLPHDEGSILGILYREGQVREIDYQEEGIYLKALVPEALYSKVKEYSLNPSRS